MAFALTTRQILLRQKYVTRRLAWRSLRPGTKLYAVDQTWRSRKKAEVLAKIQVVDVRQEPLDRLLHEPRYGLAEVAKEGFLGQSIDEFVAFFCRTHQIEDPSTIVTRIEFRYLDGASPTS